MSRIKQLSPQEAQKIAAGEVVERPSNVVKELVENALDASARNISLYIEDGGKKLIRIVDDGSGMSKDDAYMCIKQHATSKISTVADLQALQTFGFRGEALASISAVSKLTLITKEAHEQAGIELQIREGNVEQEAITSCNSGTDICVQDIFFNIPARKKFLKSKETEWRAISQLFHAYSFAYPHIHFKLFSDNKLIHTCPAVSSLSERLAQLYDRTLLNACLLFEAKEERMNLKISGITTDAQYNRYDRNGIFVFVNQRWIKNYKLAQAIVKGYQGILPTGKWPASFLFITLDSEYVDINIHPRKEEVQFLHPRVIESLIESTIKERLEKRTSATLGFAAGQKYVSSKAELEYLPAKHDRPEELDQSALPVINISSDPYCLQSPGNYSHKIAEFHSSVNNLHTSNSKSNSLEVGKPIPLGLSNKFTDKPLANNEARNEPFKPVNVLTALTQDDRVSSKQDKTDHLKFSEALESSFGKELQKQSITPQEKPAFATLTKNAALALSASNDEQQASMLNQKYRILGQLQTTYILIETTEGLVFIDQHAAHERIVYEKLRKNFENVPTIKLLFPQVISLNQDDIAAIHPYLSLFLPFGLLVEPISSRELIVQEVPVFLKNQPIAEMIKQIVGWIHEYQHIEKTQLHKILHEKIHAQVSCLSSIKAGDELTHEGMAELINDLYALENKLTCPHGRPTLWLITQQEIKKKFKRDYR